MRRILKIVLVIVAVILIIIGLNTVLTNAGIKTPISETGDQLTAKATNAVIEATDIKGKAEEFLRSNSAIIAEKTGLPEMAVNGIIDQLNIKEWNVVALPSDAVATGTVNVNIEGMPTEITTYEDPSIVTMDANDASVTFEVPLSARAYISYLKYLG